jgi:hypothetical protein
VDEVIEAFRDGKLEEPRYWMPGCMGKGRSRRRWRQRQGRGCGRFNAGNLE